MVTFDSRFQGSPVAVDKQEAATQIGDADTALTIDYRMAVETIVSAAGDHTVASVYVDRNLIVAVACVAVLKGILDQSNEQQRRDGCVSHSVDIDIGDDSSRRQTELHQ